MNFNIRFDLARGLVMTWSDANGFTFTDLPLRVRLRGANTFYVWGGVESGEGLPAWAESDLVLELFGRGEVCRVETISEDGRITGYRAITRHPRVEAVLEIRDQAGELAMSILLRNPQNVGGRRLPLSRFKHFQKPSCS